MNFDWSLIIKPNKPANSFNDIQLFEDTLGFELPEDYRNFLWESNGGRVTVENKIEVPDIPFDLNVSSLLGLTSSGAGLSETRARQQAQRLCLRQALAIADNGGTGEYYLALAGEKRGAVFFVWLDHRPTLEPDDWDTLEINIPVDLMEVCPTFDDFGQIIYDSRMA
jgi:hypothetical protein